MWTNQQQTKAPSVPPTQGSGSPVMPSNETPSSRVSPPGASNLSHLGPTLRVKGTISGTEDLEIDGKVEGPLSLPGQKLTVGPSAQLNSEIAAGEAIVYGKISGNICAGDRVEIKKGSEVMGDIKTARIGIEDGAHFKGRIEIDRAKPAVAPESTGVSIAAIGNYS